MPDRTGSACVVGGTRVLLANGQRLNIEDVLVVWDDIYVDPTGITKGLWNGDPSTIQPIRSSLTGKEVYPVWRFGGWERNPLVKIPVENITSPLFATEWHPVVKQDPIRGSAKLIPAEFLKHDDLVYVESNTPQSTGKVTQAFNKRVPNQSTKVYGLGLADLEFLQIYVNDPNEKEYLESLERRITDEFPVSWSYILDFINGVIQRLQLVSGNPLGLDLVDHVFYTNHIATGALTLQYLLVKKLSEGVEIDALESLLQL